MSGRARRAATAAKRERSRFRHDYADRLPQPHNLDDYVQRLVRLNQFRGIPEQDFGKRLFDLNLADLRELPAALLLRKEEPLPENMIPTTEGDLDELIRALIHRGGDGELIGLHMSGWPGADGTCEAWLDRVVTELWKLAVEDRRLFSLLISGYHGSALEAAAAGKFPPSIRDGLARALAWVILLWGANDLQLTISALNLADHEPFGSWPANPALNAAAGPFYLSDHKLITPLAGIKSGREVYQLANELLLKLPGLPDEERDRRFAEIMQTKPEIAGLAVALKARGSQQLEASFGPLLPGLIAAAQGLVGYGGADSFWYPVTHPGVDPRLNGQTFCHLWYGMSSVQAAAVAILRYLQLEATVLDLVRGAMAGGRNGDPRIAFGGFKAKALPYGTMKRAAHLLDVYRRLILDDKDLRSRTTAEEKDLAGAPGGDVGGPSLRRARKHLERLGRRKPSDETDTDLRRRAFYMLDVLPDVRLKRLWGTPPTQSATGPSPQSDTPDKSPLGPDRTSAGRSAGPSPDPTAPSEEAGRGHGEDWETP